MATDPITYTPDVAWETMVKNVVWLTDWTYRITVSPENFNNKGAGEVLIGYYLIDDNGEQFTFTALNVGGIAGNYEVTDEFKVGYGPVTDRTAIICQSVGEGIAPFLSPVQYDRLDSTARAKRQSVELDILWKHRGIAIGDDINITKIEVEGIEATVNSDPLLGWAGGWLLKLKALFTTFLSLTDTPTTYLGQALKALRVNAAADGIEFYTPESGSTGIEWQGFSFFDADTEDVYEIDPAASEAYHISTIFIKTDIGTITFSAKINGVAITGLSGITATATRTEFTATALNAVAIGDIVTLVITSRASSPTKLIGKYNNVKP